MVRDDTAEGGSKKMIMYVMSGGSIKQRNYMGNGGRGGSI